MTTKTIKQIKTKEYCHYLPFSVHPPIKEFHRKNLSSFISIFSFYYLKTIS